MNPFRCNGKTKQTRRLQLQWLRQGGAGRSFSQFGANLLSLSKGKLILGKVNRRKKIFPHKLNESFVQVSTLPLPAKLNRTLAWQSRQIEYLLTPLCPTLRCLWPRHAAQTDAAPPSHKLAWAIVGPLLIIAMLSGPSLKRPKLTRRRRRWQAERGTEPRVSSA